MTATSVERVANAARRGDLCAIVRTHRDYVIGAGATTERTTVELELVTSVTREGVVKRTAFRPGAAGSDLRGYPTVYVVPASSLSADWATVYAALPRYDGHDQVRPFSSVEECREFLRQFKA